MDHVLIIANPASGKFSESHFEEAEKFFRQRGISAVFRLTAKPKEATFLAAEGKGRYDAVVAMGGDGTIHEVVNGLAGSNTPLGVIPSGTGNVLARGLGIPRRLLKGALEAIVGRKSRRIDLGMINGAYFVMVAGIGFDALVASKVSPAMKRRFGVLAYALAAGREILRYKASPLRMEAEGRLYRGASVVVQNSKIFGGPLSFAPSAEPDDGLLDLVLFERMSPFFACLYATGGVFGRVAGLPGVACLKTPGALVCARERVPVHLDAERGGVTPVKLSVCKGSLQVLTP